MARGPRIAPGGLVYHVLNRAAGRNTLFRSDKDYLAFQRLIVEAQSQHKLELFAYTVMPNHWHFVCRPENDGDLTAFFRWLTLTHAMRWRVARHTVGYGPLYQGRFKSFPIQEDRHFLVACRYIERNPLTAKLAARAEAWPWGSLYLRLAATPETGEAVLPALSDWPVDQPHDWVSRVNEPMSGKEIERMRTSLKRSRPMGSSTWTERTVARLGLEHTLRREGRPSKQTAEGQI